MLRQKRNGRLPPITRDGPTLNFHLRMGRWPACPTGSTTFWTRQEDRRIAALPERCGTRIATRAGAAGHEIPAKNPPGHARSGSFHCTIDSAETCTCFPDIILCRVRFLPRVGGPVTLQQSRFDGKGGFSVPRSWCFSSIFGVFKVRDMREGLVRKFWLWRLKWEGKLHFIIIFTVSGSRIFFRE